MAIKANVAGPSITPVVIKELVRDQSGNRPPKRIGAYSYFILTAAHSIRNSVLYRLAEYHGSLYVTLVADTTDTELEVYVSPGVAAEWFRLLVMAYVYVAFKADDYTAINALSATKLHIEIAALNLASEFDVQAVAELVREVVKTLLASLLGQTAKDVYNNYYRDDFPATELAQANQYYDSVVAAYRRLLGISLKRWFDISCRIETCRVKGLVKKVGAARDEIRDAQDQVRKLRERVGERASTAEYIAAVAVQTNDTSEMLSSLASIKRMIPDIKGFIVDARRTVASTAAPWAILMANVNEVKLRTPAA